MRLFMGVFIADFYQFSRAIIEIFLCAVGLEFAFDPSISEIFFRFPNLSSHATIHEATCKFGF